MKNIVVVPRLVCSESRDLNAKSRHSDNDSGNNPFAVFPVNFCSVNGRGQKGEGSAACYHCEIPNGLTRRRVNVSGKAVESSSGKSRNRLSQEPKQKEKAGDSVSRMEPSVCRDGKKQILCAERVVC